MLQISNEDLASIKNNHPRQWSKLVSDQFEIAKCSVNPKNPHEVFTIRCPPVLCKTVETLKDKKISELVKEYRRHKVEWDDDENEFVLPYSTMESLFLPVATKIIVMLTDMLQKPECKFLNKIVLVGGFAESSLLFKKIEERFASANVMVKRSTAPWLSVLKGAVMLAKHNNIHLQKSWDDFKHEKNHNMIKPSKDQPGVCG